MTDPKKPENNDSDAFDDVLFSKSEPEDAAVVAKPASDDEGFDGVLFLDDEPPAPSYNKPQKLQAPKPTLKTQKTADTSTVPTLMAGNKKGVKDNKPDGLSGDLDAFEDVTHFSQKKNIEEDDYSADALFASDEDLERALDQADAATAKPCDVAQDDAEAIEGALFTSDDDLEKALDDFSPDAKPVKKAAVQQAAAKIPTKLPPVDLPKYLQNFICQDRPSASCWFADSLEANDFDAVDASLQEFDWPEQYLKPEEPKVELTKAWQKIQYQCQLHLGKFTPAREISLDFKNPIQKPKKNFPDLLNHRQIQNLLARKGANVNNSIAKVQLQLQWQNTCRLGFSERLRHIEPIKDFVLSANNHLLQRFVKQALQSHDKESVQSATLHIASIRLLLQALRILINEAYAWPKAIYQQRQETFRALLLDYVALAHAELIFAAAAHMQVSNITVKTLNKIFQVIEQDEPSLLDASLSLALINKNMAVASAFAYWQMLYALDLPSLPTSLLPTLLEYLDKNQQDDWRVYREADSVTDADYLTWQLEQDKPAVCGQGIDGLSQGLLLSPLFNAIKQDYMLLLEVVDLQQSAKQEPWPALSWADKVSLASFLMQALQLLQRGIKPGKYSVYRPEKLQLAVGFTNIVECLTGKDNTAVANEKPVIGAVGIFKTAWQTAFSDEQQMFLQAEEAQIKQALVIGDAVLLEQFSPELNAWQLSLWVIKRLLRDEMGAVQLQLQALGAKPLLVRDKNEQAFCLAFTQDQQAIAVTDAMSQLPEQALIINYGEQEAAVALKQLQFLSRHCQVFLLQK